MTSEKLAYHRKYNLARYYRLKDKAHTQLGGKCMLCGSIYDLEIDHIDRATKSFSPLDKILSMPWASFEEELKKCQLLCKTCHATKTLSDLNKEQIKGQNKHGTLSSYRYCGPPKCKECKEAKRIYTNEYRVKHGR